MSYQPTSPTNSVDPVALIRARLQAHGSRIVQDQGDDFMAQCPGHLDVNPSLHVSRAQDGSALVYCHAGCVLQRVLDPLDLDLPFLFTDRYKDKDEDEGLRDGLQGPCIRETEDRQAELYGLVEAYERGEIEPEDVVLGDLPRHASRDDRRVIADFKLLMGLRRASSDFKPLPYATRFCCRRMGWSEDRPMRAWRVLSRLERWGVIVSAGTLAPRPGFAHRTKCYDAPPLGVDVAQRAPVTAEVDVQPPAEVLDKSRMDRTQAARREHKIAVTTGYGADAVDSPTAVAARTRLDLVQAENDNPERHAVWVSHGGSVGHYAYPTITPDGELVPF